MKYICVGGNCKFHKKKKIKKEELTVNLSDVFIYLKKKNKKAYQELFDILYIHQKQMQKSGFKIKIKKKSITLPNGERIEI